MPSCTTAPTVAATPTSTPSRDSAPLTGCNDAGSASGLCQAPSPVTLASLAPSTPRSDAAIATVTAAGSQRQRRVASRPSGNSIATPTVATNHPTVRSDEPVTAHADAAGTLPGAATIPRYAASAPALPTAHMTPPASMSQPMRLPGRADATTAPTTANAATTAALSAASSSDRSSAAAAHSETVAPAAETMTAAVTTAAVTLFSSMTRTPE